MARKFKTECDWCHKPFPLVTCDPKVKAYPQPFIITGMSKEQICKACSEKCDSLGYDTNEL